MVCSIKCKLNIIIIVPSVGRFVLPGAVPIPHTQWTIGATSSLAPPDDDGTTRDQKGVAIDVFYDDAFIDFQIVDIESSAYKHFIEAYGRRRVIHIFIVDLEFVCACHKSSLQTAGYH